jgi:hypothetical protein
MKNPVRFRVGWLILGLVLGCGVSAVAADATVAELGTKLADAKAPLQDRIRAIVSLQAQARKLTADEQTAVAPAVFGVITTPPKGDQKAVAWLVSRGLELLPSLPVTPDLVQAVAKIVADPSQDLDVRVRAAVALGSLSKTHPLPQPNQAFAAIRSLAIETLQVELDAAARRRLETEFSMGNLANLSMTQPTESGFRQEGFGREGGREGFGQEDADSVSKAECRRAAWRLVQLADAIAPAKGSKDSGIAGGLKAAELEAARGLADGIRGIALEGLHAQTFPAPASAGEGGMGRAGMDGMVPTGFDAVIEAALEKAKALPEVAAAK